LALIFYLFLLAIGYSASSYLYLMAIGLESGRNAFSTRAQGVAIAQNATSPTVESGSSKRHNETARTRVRTRKAARGFITLNNAHATPFLHHCAENYRYNIRKCSLFAQPIL
jgi:hypothetical protein